MLTFLAAKLNWFTVVEVSVYQGPDKATPAIFEAGRAPAMDVLVPAPLCATLLTCVPALPLGST